MDSPFVREVFGLAGEGVRGVLSLLQGEWLPIAIVMRGGH